MRVLFISSEIAPLAKTGGLADVSTALPAALAAAGVDVRLMMPGYPSALESIRVRRTVADLGDMPGAGRARILEARMPDSGLPVWLLECPELFERDGTPYQDAEGRDWPDNAARFGTLCRAAVRIATGTAEQAWIPDVIHCNDWQTGLIPALLRARSGPRRPPRPATVFTIHNMAFQGIVPWHALDGLGLDFDGHHRGEMDHYGQASFLKAGLRFGDRLTTVSPTYAREIKTPEYGFGLEDTIRARQSDLTGILNGIDDWTWNPSRDPYLSWRYDTRDMSGKKMTKGQVQAELGLKVAPDTMLVAFISRLTDQKMADLLPEIVPGLMERGMQFALIGEGDREIQAAVKALASRYPGRVSVRTRYEEPLAHRLYAGADVLLAPARFEPCGLAQMYAMRYGTLPVVTRVGGLADTVINATPKSLRSGAATGFVATTPDATSLMKALKRSFALYREPIAWRRIQSAAMQRNYSWERSAAHYLSIYRDVREQGGPAAAQNRIQLVRDNRRPKEQSRWQSAQNHRLKQSRAGTAADELSA